MSVKKVLKQIVGEKRLSNLKGEVCHYGCLLFFALKQKARMTCAGNQIQVKCELSSPAYHIYRGYYDLRYMDSKGELILCHRLPVKAHTNRDTKCEIGYYDLKKLEFTKLAETNAWCWQQGSRLRWYPENAKWVMFNDVSDDSYCTRIVDIETQNDVKKIDYPIYDISSDCKWGISLNYSRLQRLRPGYGYNYFEDKTLNQNAPSDDGLYLIDIENNKPTLIVSLKELADKINNGSQYVHYLNHVSIAPDNNHFIFFHIYTKIGEKRWGTVLYVYSVKDSAYYAIEKVDRVSHYCWIDNENMMVTCHREDGSEYYATYNVLNGEKRILDIDGLGVDGHPNRLGDGELFITDTYPQQKSIQYIELFKESSRKVTKIAELYHDYRMRGEQRCDLHPSVEDDGRYVAVDTTYHGGRRSIVIFKNSMEEIK